MVVHQSHVAIVIVALKSIEICLYKVKVVLNRLVVQFLIHIKWHKIIRLNYTNILTCSLIKTDIHAYSITAIFLVNNNDTVVFLRITL